MTQVVFRKWRANPKTVIALFPLEFSDYAGMFCTSYEHIGQHGGADYTGVIARTVPATPAEYADLLAELISLGYDDLVIKRKGPSYSILSEARKKFRLTLDSQ